MTLADVFAVGTVLDLPDGTSFTMRKPTLLEQGELQRFLEKRAHDAVDRSEASQEEKDRRHHLIDVDAGLGKYEYDGEIAYQYQWTVPGITKVVTIIGRGQGITEAQAAELVKAKLKRVVSAVLARVDVDPKAFAPALAALGFPTDWLSAEPSEPSSNNCSTPPSTGPSPNSDTAPTSNCPSCTPSSAGPTGT